MELEFQIESISYWNFHSRFNIYLIERPKIPYNTKRLEAFADAAKEQSIETSANFRWSACEYQSGNYNIGKDDQSEDILHMKKIPYKVITNMQLYKINGSEKLYTIHGKCHWNKTIHGRISRLERPSM